MRQPLLLIAAVALVGCGKKTTPAEPETNAEPKVAAKKQEPPKDDPKEPIPAKSTPVEPTPAEKAAVEKAAVEKAAAEKATAIKKVADEAQANAFVNTLGMKFVQVLGTEVQFCIWETRVKDYAAYAAAYAAANAGVDGRWKKPGFKQETSHPVVNVSWNDAQAFCEWLTKKEMAARKIKAGQKYRLPTDAEWSVAVGLGHEKGNTPEKKKLGIWGVSPWGKEWPPPKEAGNYDESLKVDSFKHTAPVGSFVANKFGLHDMGGNVWEWCEDKWSQTSTEGVLRGAAWRGYGRGGPELSSYRRPGIRGGRVNDFGFRCVLVSGSGE